MKLNIKCRAYKNRTSRRRIIVTLLLPCIFFTASVAGAEIAVIVNPNSIVDKAKIMDVKHLFLGKTSFLAGESEFIPISQTKGSPERKEFEQLVLGKNAKQLQAYWSKLIFTGKGTPPKSAGGNEEIKDLIRKNPNLIGYIDSKYVDSTVKVLLTIEQAK